MVTNTPRVDLVYDCPNCGERIEVIGITWTWLLSLMNDIYTQKQRLYLLKCQLEMLKMALVLLLDMEPYAQPETLVIGRNPGVIQLKENDSATDHLGARALPAQAAEEVHRPEA